KRAGSAGAPGQTLALRSEDGSTVVAVGVGDPEKLDAAALRDAAGASARAAARDARIALSLASGLGALGGELVGQALVEGAVLGRYSYDGLRRSSDATALQSLTIVSSSVHVEALRLGA